MQLKPFTTDNTYKVSPVYPFDTAVSLNSIDFYNDENLNLTFSDALSSIIDVKTNNFSHLFLSKRRALPDLLTVNPLTPMPESFSTFFAFRAVEGTNSQTLYWTVDESVDENAAVAALHQGPVNGPLTNSNFFDIVFTDALTCQIRHENKGAIRYLTIDYTYNLSFVIDMGLAALGPDDPQRFYYFYDESNDLVILYKKILDFPYFISYSTATGFCTLLQPPLGPYFPFSTTGIVRMRPHADPSSFYALRDHEAVYAKTFNPNQLNTSDELSRSGVKNNYLLNAEIGKITADSLPVNILTLKNELTPENANVFKNDFFNTDQFEYRQYNKIFSGTQQKYGNDNIALGYDGYTTRLTFKADKITYFHVPYNIYPYKQLNINDTHIAKAGAIAGDHPVKADKIFKKRATYGDHGAFGNSSDEANGQFLCAWLSGSADVNVSPIWVDRYYNPSLISFTTALSTTNSTAYQSNFNNLNVSPTLAAVFDKPSDLYFEPGVYYAYHHLGAKDIENYLRVLAPATIQTGLVNYYINNTPSDLIPGQLNEFSFDGQQYSVTNSLSSVADTNQFTIAFDLNCHDWSSNFANQIVGNYITDGFGIFNQRYITPFLYLFAADVLYLYNSTGRLVHAAKFPDEIRAVWRQGNLNNYYVLLKTGTIMSCNASNTIVGAVSAVGYNFEDIVCSFYDLSGAVFVGANTPARTALYFDFTANTLTPVTDVTTLNNTTLSSCGTIVRYNNTFYGVSGYDGLLSNGILYFLSSQTQIDKWDLNSQTTSPMFNATTPIRSFNIDKNGNFWLLQDTKFYKYTPDRLLLLEGYIDNASKEGQYINFGNEFLPTGENYYTLITTHTLNSSAGKANNSVELFRYTSDGAFINQFSTPTGQFVKPLIDQNITADDFVRREAIFSDYNNTVNVRVTLFDIIKLQTDEFNLSFNVAQLGAGYHNFTVRLDGLRGSLALFVNGIKVDEILVSPGQYVLNKTFDRPLTIGATPFTGNTTLAQYLKSPLFYVTNSQIKNFAIYNVALNDFDIRLIASRNHDIPDIGYNVPAGKRGYLDEIERFFKQDVPIKKSSKFNMKMINLGNIPDSLKATLTNAITSNLEARLPYEARLNQVKWIN